MTRVTLKTSESITNVLSFGSLPELVFGGAFEPVPLSSLPSLSFLSPRSSFGPLFCPLLKVPSTTPLLGVLLSVLNESDVERSFQVFIVLIWKYMITNSEMMSLKLDLVSSSE